MAVACALTTPSGSVATLLLLPCPAAGPTGPSGSTRTRLRSPASAAALIVPTFAAAAKNSLLGCNALVLSALDVLNVRAAVSRYVPLELLLQERSSVAVKSRLQGKCFIHCCRQTRAVLLTRPFPSAATLYPCTLIAELERKRSGSKMRQRARTHAKSNIYQLSVRNIS